MRYRACETVDPKAASAHRLDRRLERATAGRSVTRSALERRAVEDHPADPAEVVDARRGIACHQHEIRALADGDLAEVGVLTGEEAGVLPRRHPERLTRREARVDELHELEME